MCADWVAGYHLNSRRRPRALNLSPSYRRAAVAGCYLTRETKICRNSSTIMKSSNRKKQFLPHFGNITRQSVYLTCHCPIAQLPRSGNVRPSIFPPPRVPAIGANGPSFSTIGAHWGLTWHLGPGTWGDRVVDHKSSFADEQPSVELTKDFLCSRCQHTFSE